MDTIEDMTRNGFRELAKRVNLENDNEKMLQRARTKAWDDFERNLIAQFIPDVIMPYTKLELRDSGRLPDIADAILKITIPGYAPIMFAPHPNSYQVYHAVNYFGVAEWRRVYSFGHDTEFESWELLLAEAKRRHIKALRMLEAEHISFGGDE